jgi:tRNA1(Val) A37 N6-methylase TrmN6
MQTFSAVTLSHKFLSPALRNAQLVIDATAGNGHDSLFLAANTPANAIVWCFDVQQTALERTCRLLENYKLEKKAKFILDNHSHIPAYIKTPIDAAVFNLGYMPGENHRITTQAHSTVQALQICVKLLKVRGVLTVAAYPGHVSGYSENIAVREYLSSLPSSQFFVGSWMAVNQAKLPPVLYVIEKTRSEAREGTTACKN